MERFESLKEVGEHIKEEQAGLDGYDAGLRYAAKVFYSPGKYSETSRAKELQEVAEHGGPCDTEFFGRYVLEDDSKLPTKEQLRSIARIAADMADNIESKDCLQDIAPGL